MFFVAGELYAMQQIKARPAGVGWGVARIERQRNPGPPHPNDRPLPGFAWRSTRATGLVALGRNDEGGHDRGGSPRPTRHQAKALAKP